MQSFHDIASQFNLQPLSRLPLSKDQIEQVQLQARKDLLDKLESFPFGYVGGGYFRDKRIPKGDKAEVLHGDELLKQLKKFIMD